MVETIFVPLDGSKAGESVFPYVEEMSARLGAAVEFLALSELLSCDHERLFSSYLDWAMQDMKSRLGRRGVTAQLRGKVLLGSASEELPRRADEAGASLIVMPNTIRREQTSAALLANIATKVLKGSQVPVLLTPADRGDAIRLSWQVRRILVPLDGSAESEASIPCATLLGKAFSSELQLYHASSSAATWVAYGMERGAYRAMDDERRAAASYLQGIRGRLADTGLITSLHVGHGPAAELIVDYARSSSADVIAMSTHGRSGMAHVIFGSVTEKVLRTAHTSVLAVRSTQ